MVKIGLTGFHYFYDCDGMNGEGQNLIAAELHSPNKAKAKIRDTSKSLESNIYVK